MDKKKIIPVIMDEETADRAHTRDPKVWKDGEHYYMVLGSTYKEQGGRVLFYRSKDAVEWEYVNQCRSSSFGRILECPDLFEANGEYVFIGSPMSVTEDGLEYAHQAMCTLADYDASTCEMTLKQEMQLIDHGMDLYAPQTNIDRDGRRVMIAWMRMPKEVEKPESLPWRGMMCLPRVIEVENGQICFRVHPEVEKYFDKKAEQLPEEIHPSHNDIPVQMSYPEGSYDIPCELDIGGYRLWIEDDRVRADRSRVYKGIEGYRLTGNTPKLGGRYELDIFVDHNLIETFVNGGQYVLSHVVYGV